MTLRFGNISNANSLQCLLDRPFVVAGIVEHQIELLNAFSQSPDLLENVHLRQNDQVWIRFNKKTLRLIMQTSKHLQKSLPSCLDITRI